jgi:hypothetical protein
MNTVRTMMSTIAKTAISASTLTLFAACAGQQTRLAPGDLRSLSSQPQIHAVHHVPARIFWVESTGYTAAGVLISPLIVLAQTQESRKLQADFGLTDPAARVKGRLVAMLQNDIGLTNIRTVPDAPKDDTIELLKQTFQTGAVLDVRTTKWGIDNNRAKYSARARLVRLADSTILWEATCNEFVADKAKPGPTREALAANDGALLKTKLGEVADLCADQLWAWAAMKDR